MAPKGSSSSKKHGSGHGSSGRRKTIYGGELTFATAPPLSFCFIINELRFDECEYDDYHHAIPPTNPARYTSEIPGKVMRYYDGNIQEFPGFYWNRDNSPQRSEGDAWYFNPDTNQYESNLVKYKSFAVFACNPLLPIMICPSDPFVVDTQSSWHLLQIFHPRNLPGVSQVAYEDSPMGEGPGLVRHVAGGRPSWVPSLIPAIYKWPLPNPPPPSGGLGGELPIVLGLMALSAEPDSPDQNSNTNTNEVFLGHRRKWRERRWFGERAGGHPPTASYPPRGYFVTVFLDPCNPQGSTSATLSSFEWNQVIVSES